MGNDPGDRHVLAAAVHAAAGVIVTHDLRHFPPAALEPFGIAAGAPDAFLLDQFDLDQTSVVAVLRRQATRRRRAPRTVPEILDSLARSGAPKFAAKLRSVT